MELTFYDRSGRAAAYTEDRIHIYLFGGHAVAYMDQDSVYDYSGRHIGWLVDGWVIEHSGRYVLFTEEAKGGPLKPKKARKPAKVVKQVPPAKGVMKKELHRPEVPTAWSGLTGEQFFEWYSSL